MGVERLYGEDSRPSQGYNWKLEVNQVVIGSGFGNTRIMTPANNLEKEDLVEDFDQILAIRNQLKKKTGICLPIKIEFDYSKRSPRKTMKIIESDSEQSELWKKLEEGQ